MTDYAKYPEIIIWGASFPPGNGGGSDGHAIERVAAILKSSGAWDRVAAIVDSNARLHGRTRLNIEVQSPAVIRNHPNALIIINTISFRAVEKAMMDMGVQNDCVIIPYYFYHGIYDKAEAKADIERNQDKIRTLYYLKDAETKCYIELMISMRLKGEDDLYAPQYYEGTGFGVDYFCDPDIVPKGPVTYIDVGAYDGNSIEPVQAFYGERLKKCVAFEPDGDSRNRLKRYLEEHDIAEITDIFPYALGDKNTQTRFSSTGLTSKVDRTGDAILEQRSFDSLDGIKIVGDAMVKMDIEGSEMDALRGMASFIQQSRPYLAVCIYHKAEDLLEIAEFIKRLNPGYRLYIRGGWHTECWAVPERHFI